MGVYLNLVDHDKMFAESKTSPAIVNYYDLSNQAQMEELNSTIFTSYHGDSLEVVPSCECGSLKGTYNVGLKCESCHTECVPVTERPLESVLWVAVPEGIDALVNPEVWIILRKKLTDSGISILEWLTNPRYSVPAEKEPISIKKLKQMGIGRGYNYFIRNFDAIMDTLINKRVLRVGKQEEREELMRFIVENRSALFPKHIPIPSKMAFITESSAMGTYADPTMVPAIDAIRTISSIENSVTPLSMKTKELRVVQTIMKLADYYESFYSKSLGTKGGWFRKHIYGSRTHFSFRAVISSLTEPHVYNELHLPWSMSVMVFELHLKSKLLKRGFTPNDALRHIYEHTLKYDPLIDELFQELIAESPTGAIPVFLQRNPSLTRGSAQLLGVTKIKTNPNINTISVSVLILSSFNADFDGDQLNGLLIHDAEMLKSASRLEPHLYALDLNTPRSLSGFLALPGPVVASIANWVHDY